MAMMQTINHHAGLMTRMADTVDADLAEALLRGDIDGATLRGAVLRCTTCTAAGTCAHWLAEHADGPAQPVPDFCVNHDLMDRLRP